MRKSTLWLMLFGLMGCTAGPITREITAGSDGAGLAAPALRSTAAAFLGKNGGGGSSGGGSSFEIDPDVFEPTSKTPLRKVTDRRIGLRFGQDWQTAPKTGIHLGLALDAGQSRYALPRGMGVLTEPTRIAMTNLSITPEVAAYRDLHLLGQDMRLKAGLGRQMAVIDTSVTSALLDVQHRGFEAANFASVSAEWHPTPSPLTLAGQARMYQNHDVRILAEARLTLPH